jgi:hypothetical protein
MCALKEGCKQQFVKSSLQECLGLSKQKQVGNTEYCITKTAIYTDYFLILR